GEGVLPGLGREEALRYIATNIGSSRKRSLSPEERRRLVVTGQYGVGLLGFWSIGRRMEIRSRVLSGRRLAEYLAAELRGPILASGVEMEVHDAMAKGTAQKRFSVVPRRFTGTIAARCGLA